MYRFLPINNSKELCLRLSFDSFDIIKMYSLKYRQLPFSRTCFAFSRKFVICNYHGRESAFMLIFWLMSVPNPPPVPSPPLRFWKWPPGNRVMQKEGKWMFQNNCLYRIEMWLETWILAYFLYLIEVKSLGIRIFKRNSSYNICFN